jgi:hypothetical protein
VVVDTLWDGLAHCSPGPDPAPFGQVHGSPELDKNDGLGLGLRLAGKHLMMQSDSDLQAMRAVRPGNGHVTTPQWPAGGHVTAQWPGLV